MTFDEYLKQSSRTCPDLGQATANDLHMVMGLVTEASEILDAYKKQIAYGKTKDVVNIQEELGDLMWYFANFCRMNDFDFYKILDVNIKKLEARYPDKFSKEKALNRNLEKEREILDELGYKE